MKFLAKSILLACMLSTFSVFATSSDDGCISCQSELSGKPDTSNIVELSNTINPDIEHLANRICARMTLAHSTGTSSSYEVFESVILNYLGVTRADSSYRSKVTDFWNRYSDQMVCTDEMVGFPSPQHILKRVVELDAVSAFYFEYFLKDRAANINSVEYVNGEPETLLDYIDSVLNTPNANELYNVSEIRQLRAFITTLMGAKTAREVLRT